MRLSFCGLSAGTGAENRSPLHRVGKPKNGSHHFFVKRRPGQWIMSVLRPPEAGDCGTEGSPSGRKSRRIGFAIIRRCSCAQETPGQPTNGRVLHVDKIKRMCAHSGDDGTISLSSSKPIFGMTPPDKTRSRRTHRQSPQYGLFEAPRRTRRAPSLPGEDNTPEGLRALLAANVHYRQAPWPEPYRHTSHRLRLGDARNLAGTS